MGQNDISVNVNELNFIIDDIKKICLELIFVNKKIEGYTCKSEVIDNYARLYRELYMMVHNYYILFLHDLKSIIDVCTELNKIDNAIAFNINNAHLMGGH